MARRGRSALNKKVHEQIIKAIRAGCHFNVAAQAAGINLRTLERWIQRGEVEKKGKYVDFANAIKDATAEAEVNAVAIIRNAMLKKWQAAAWYLERKHPERWARTERPIEDSKEKNASLDILSLAQSNNNILDSLTNILAELTKNNGKKEEYKENPTG